MWLHLVKAIVIVRQYRENSKATFHGPRDMARYNVNADLRTAAPRPNPKLEDQKKPTYAVLPEPETLKRYRQANINV